MSLLAELRRRNVIRMAGLYLVGAWLVVQVTGTVSPMLGAPEWVGRTVLALLAIGFPLALVVAWVFELTPEGLKRDGEVPAGASVAPQTARRMNRMLLVLMALALGCFAVDKFVLAPGKEPVATAATAPATPAEARAPATADPRSIAMLAFANMSADEDNEYFSDGVAEEILNALAQVGGLKVAGRTSSFYFKGRNQPLAEIGAALGVAHVLEGSVRKQGNRLRITAQLIRVSDGFHLWSDTFDGTDADIFALQERIARQVTRKLEVALGAGDGKTLINVGTVNPEAYALYLQATDIFNRRDGARFGQAVGQLQRAVALDPGFARAWSRMGALQLLSSEFDDGDVGQSVREATASARRALEQQPNLAEPHAVIALALSQQHQYLAARAEFERALSIEPDDLVSNFW